MSLGTGLIVGGPGCSSSLGLFMELGMSEMIPSAYLVLIDRTL